jgi:hypothetical protein
MLKDLYTIVYYTSNRENPEFEQKIIDNLKEQAGDIPIISVSQKPMNLGKNICVGDVGFSYLNEWRQILIGAKEAKTPYIIFAESDFLYPSEYFKLDPVEDMYVYDNIWIVMNPKYGDWFWRKKQSEGAQIVKRELLIEKYEKYLEGYPMWWNGEIVIGKRGDSPLRYLPFKTFTGNPAISFKTGDGLRAVTNVNNKNVKRELPYWGSIKKIREKYYGDKTK